MRATGETTRKRDPQPQEPSITALRKVVTELGITSRTELARQPITQRKTD